MQITLDIRLVVNQWNGCDVDIHHVVNFPLLLLHFIELSFETKNVLEIKCLLGKCIISCLILYALCISDFKKRKIMKSQKSAQELEPSGLDALASAAVLGDSMADLQESGTTTRHPRHRQGCTCIVCIQPPSGKGKHKSTCTCNVCLTVKRRFKTLMLRKKKRLSEREMETSLKEGNSQFDESGTSGTLRGTSLQINHSENERSQIRVKDEEAANSSGQIDLNCHPDREDMQLEVAGLSMMSLVEAASQPLDSYSKQIGVSSVTSEQHSSQPSSAESERPLSEEGCHGSAHESTSDRGRGPH